MEQNIREIFPLLVALREYKTLIICIDPYSVIFNLAVTVR